MGSWKEGGKMEVRRVRMWQAEGARGCKAGVKVI